MNKVTLLVLEGDAQGARYELSEGTAEIGRGVRNDYRIIDTEVSRRHAAIQFESDAYWLLDRNSSNGTLVNGMQVNRHELKHGDRIQIGRTVLLFTHEKPADESSMLDDVIHIVGDSVFGQESAIVQAMDHTESQPLANLRALYRITEAAVSPSMSQDEMLQRILDLTIDVVGAARGSVLLTNEVDEILPRIYADRRGDRQSGKMVISSSIVHYVVHHGRGVVTSDAQHDTRFQSGKSIINAGIREAMCVPMQGHYKLQGVIYVDITSSPLDLERAAKERQFTDEELRLLVAIGRQAALAIEGLNFQTALVKAERFAAMGQTITVLSHHVKNILQGIRGGSYLIDLGLNKSEEQMVRNGWTIVERNQNKIYHLVMDMLTFSKERQPVLEHRDLNTTVREVCDLMQARALEIGVKFTSQLGELPETSFDPEAIHQAVLNIVINALDAIEESEDGAIQLETAYDQAADMLSISVTDNGPGIPESQLASIFNLFESTKGSRGTGLGLAVSQKIIREHGGDIEVENLPEQGCRFRLFWTHIEDDHRAEPVGGATVVFE